MHLELIHILGKREEVSGYVLNGLIYTYFSKIIIDELIVILALILCDCFRGFYGKLGKI